MSAPATTTTTTTATTTTATTTTARTRWRDQLGSLEDQATPLVRYGLVALAAIAAYLILTSLADRVEESRTTRLALEQETETLLTLEPEEVWAARLEESERLGARATSDLWRGATLGIIKAELETSLRAAHAAHIPTGPRAQARDARPQVTLDTEADSRNTVPTLGFSLTARLARDAGDDFIAALAALDPPLYIDELTLSIADNPRSPAVTSVSGRIRVEIVTEPTEGAAP